MRKGKSPLEVLILKQRYKKGQAASTDLVDAGMAGKESVRNAAAKAAKKEGKKGGEGRRKVESKSSISSSSSRCVAELRF